MLMCEMQLIIKCLSLLDMRLTKGRVQMFETPFARMGFLVCAGELNEQRAFLLY